MNRSLLTLTHTSAKHKSEGLAGMLGVAGTTRHGEDSAEGLQYAGMLRCLRACAEAAYGAKRTSDAASNLFASAFADTSGAQVRIHKRTFQNRIPKRSLFKENP